MRRVPHWYALQLLERIGQGWSAEDVQAALDEYLDLEAMAQVVETEHAAGHRVIRGGALHVSEEEPGG